MFPSLPLPESVWQEEKQYTVFLLLLKTSTVQPRYLFPHQSYASCEVVFNMHGEMEEHRQKVSEGNAGDVPAGEQTAWRHCCLWNISCWWMWTEIETVQSWRLSVAQLHAVNSQKLHLNLTKLQQQTCSCRYKMLPGFLLKHEITDGQKVKEKTNLKGK